MAADETYNGWSNRETWAFMLYVQNDEGMADTVLNVLAGGWYGPDVRPDDALSLWADSLFTPDAWMDEYGVSTDSWPLPLARAAGDIGSLWRINWRECVDALTADR